MAYHGYGRTHRAPGLGQTGTADYLAGHNLIKAHANAYRVYDREFRSKQQGILTMLAVMEMSSAYYVCCIHSSALQTKD